MRIWYRVKAICTLPLLPILYWQGKRVKRTMPILPEATGHQGVSPDAPLKRLRLLTIGESSVAGVGVTTHEEGFTGTLARELARLFQVGVEWKVYARRGFTVRKVQETILPQITEQAGDVDLVVVGLGGNDTFQLRRPRRWKRDMQQLIATLQQRFQGIPIVFMDLPPVRELPAFPALVKNILGNWREMLAEELDRLVLHHQHTYYHAHHITLRDWMQRYNHKNLPKLVSAYFSDGVHPSKLAYQTWATDIAHFINTHPHLQRAIEVLTNRSKS